MKIAIAVCGRFHAFDMAAAIARRGHDVRVLTNYPRWAAARFGLRPEQVESLWLHGLAYRVYVKLRRFTEIPGAEAFFHRWFGRWVAKHVRHTKYDFVHPFSGLAEELLQHKDSISADILLLRASSHIRTQHRLLTEESGRTGVALERPSRWILAREEREYQLANHIVVLSTFSAESFVSEGVPEEKLYMLPLGADLRAFQPDSATVQERRNRILSGAPLRVLFVGTLSFRKGLADLHQIVSELRDRCRFRFVADVLPEGQQLVDDMRRFAEVLPRQPQHTLPAAYAWADVFIFPTIEDGCPVVLAQAHTNGLPILTTGHCSGPDLIEEGRTGWIVGVRSPGDFIRRLRWCDEHRADLAAVAEATVQHSKLRDWDTVAQDFEAICKVVRNPQSTGMMSVKYAAHSD